MKGQQNGQRVQNSLHNYPLKWYIVALLLVLLFASVSANDDRQTDTQRQALPNTGDMQYLCYYNGYSFHNDDVVESFPFKCTQLTCIQGIVLPKYFYGNNTCGCCEYDGKIYKDGDYLPGICARLYCDCGRWVTTGHIHDCCSECRVFGDPQIVTFDTTEPYKHYRLDAPCNYSMVQRTAHPPFYLDTYAPEFAIYADMKTCNHGHSCLDKITFIDNPLTTIIIELNTLINPDTIWVNGVIYQVDYTPRYVSTGNLQHQQQPVMAWRHSERCIRLMGSQKVMLQVCEFEARIWAHSSLSDQLEGLCGRFNMYSEDDARDRSGTQWDLDLYPEQIAPEFLNSWRTLQQQNPKCLESTSYPPINVACPPTETVIWRNKCLNALSQVTHLNLGPPADLLTAAVESCIVDVCKIGDDGHAIKWIKVHFIMLHHALEVHYSTIGEHEAVPIHGLGCSSSITLPPTSPSPPPALGNLSSSYNGTELNLVYEGIQWNPPSTPCNSVDNLKMETFNASLIRKINFANLKYTWNETKGSITINATYTEDCLKYGYIHLLIPTLLVSEICDDLATTSSSISLCYPTICKLSLESDYSNIPSNNRLIFKDNFCTINKPDHWDDWIVYHFGNDSGEHYLTDPDDDGLVNILEYYGTLAFNQSYVINNQTTSGQTPNGRRESRKNARTIRSSNSLDAKSNQISNKFPNKISNKLPNLPILDTNHLIKSNQRGELRLMELPLTGSNPLIADSDGDLLLDGYEASRQMDPTTYDDAFSDNDGDGLDTLMEQIRNTDPHSSDTDGDGVNDGDETNRGSDPNNPLDNGEKPPETQTAEITVTIGDHSGSHSERYILQVGEIGHQSPGFGLVGSGTYTFRVGTYSITIKHTGSIYNPPDYDYTAQVIKTTGVAKVTVQDPSGILGYHSESSYFYAAGKSATLIVEDECPPESTEEECECAKIKNCRECNTKKECEWDAGTMTCITDSILPGLPDTCFTPECPCDKCVEWNTAELADQKWVEQLNKDLPCPCSVTKHTTVGALGITHTSIKPADQPSSKWEVDGACSSDGEPYCSTYHPGAYGCLRSSTTTSSGARQQCCFNIDGILFDPSEKAAGTPDKASGLVDHFFEDVCPYRWCCQDCPTMCDKYIDARKGDNSHCIP